MAHPKRKHSNQRSNKRFTNDRHKLKPKAYSICPQCNHFKQPHVICGNCGYYRNQRTKKMRQYLIISEE